MYPRMYTCHMYVHPIFYCIATYVSKCIRKYIRRMIVLYIHVILNCKPFTYVHMYDTCMYVRNILCRQIKENQCNVSPDSAGQYTSIFS